jgi:hypothetical protein
MKCRMFMLAFLLACPPLVMAQQCSNGVMTPGQQTKNVPCLAHYQTQTVTGTNTANDKCIDLNDDTTYMNVNSTVLGYGQCTVAASNPPCGGTGQPTCTYQLYECDPIYQIQVTTATSASDYNRFYNRAYTNSINGNGNSSVPTCNGQGTAYNQDFQQCQGVACLGGGGGQCTLPPDVCETCCPAGQVWDPATCTCKGTSPIIVDTTGKGFSLTSAEDGVMFDFNGDGKPLKLSWTAADSGNGFLALDRNHNGRIDSAKELFGNITEQPPSPDPNGFLALAEFDKLENGGNGDGIIDSRDAVFSHLLIWIDANHDGISQPNELHSLPEMGIYSLALTYTESRRTDQFGNQFRYKSAVNPDPEDGESKDGRVNYDVFLQVLKKQAGMPVAQDRDPVAAADHLLR